ncbi:hypothetical protein AAG570_008944 [Ranatra chinensis]|uniref:Phosphatidylethanolamine-binding protein n=1 Tax=Ranatra chinensis TaxID=642074 RepID=A0ABD0Z310_9HEMI
MRSILHSTLNRRWCSQQWCGFPTPYFLGQRDGKKYHYSYNTRPHLYATKSVFVVQVEWKASGVKAEGGNELAPSQVKSAPLLQWSGVGPDDMHLVCMLDPDAPSRQDPRARHWLHWLVANVPGGVVSKGEVVAAYVGAGPPKGTGLHRYVLLVFKQPKKLRMDEVRIGADSGKGRSSFSVSKLLGKYKLPAAPVASNFFQAQWDQYVPTLHKQLAK